MLAEHFLHYRVVFAIHVPWFTSRGESSQGADLEASLSFEEAELVGEQICQLGRYGSSP